MQASKIVIACALACAAMSAQAAGPTIPVGTKVIYLGGATAPDTYLADIANSLLTGVVSAHNTGNGTDYRAYLGKANGITGIANGTDILFIKRSKGGSVWGVDPVARANRTEIIDLANCTAGTGGFTWDCGVKGIDPGIAGNDSPSNVGMVPDFGVADVEPGLFREPFNTENGNPALSPLELAHLTNKPAYQLMMGVVATNAVSASTHLSRTAYGAMLAGKIQDWSSIDGSTDPVVVCRRVNGSGTQTSYNWFFTGFPCNDTRSGYLSNSPAAVSDSAGYGVGGTGTQADPILIDPTAGYTVVENTGSGDVRNCLKAAQNHTDHIVQGSNNMWYKVQFSNSTNPFKAIGVLSLDSYGKESGWSFRTMDGAGTVAKNATTGLLEASAGATGIAPTKDNLVNGKYDFVVEGSFQYRNTTVTNPNGDVVAKPDTTKQAFINEFIKRAGDIKYTGNVGATINTVPQAYASLPQYFDYVANPNTVSKYTREGNTCAPLIRY
jgi:hypothetical protein